MAYYISPSFKEQWFKSSSVILCLCMIFKDSVILYIFVIKIQGGESLMFHLWERERGGESFGGKGRGGEETEGEVV